MNIVETTDIQPQLIAVSQLERSPLNARRTVRSDGMAELKASILSHGLMQNLVVTASEGGTYLVIAGGRRLEAIRLLQAEGHLPANFAVPCQVVSDEHASEMSLAENIVRLAMHPADQFKAFSTLIDQGATATEIAQRFGIEESLVHRRMKLARVAPELLAEYRQDGMPLECLMAYTLTDDHRRQRKVFKSLQDWQKDDPHAIRDALTEKMVDARSKLAKFVGLAEYTAEGGTTRADLFGEEVYLENPKLLNKLAEKKLASVRRELEAEGWGWLEIHPERDWTLINRCTRIKPMLINAPAELVTLKSQLDAELEQVESELDESESDDVLEQQQAIQERLDQAEEALTAYVGFDAHQKMLAGCFASIGQDGSVFLDKGLVKPEHRKQLSALLKKSDDGASSTPVKDKHAFSATLLRDLADARLRIAQLEMAKHPQIAFDLLVFQSVLSVLGERDTDDGADVRFTASLLKPAPEGIAGDALTAVKASLSLDWLNEGSESARFAAFRALPETAKHSILAYSVASTLKPKLAPAEGMEATAYDLALSMTYTDVAAYWRPTKDNLLGRLTRGQLLTIVKEVLGELWVSAYAGGKKALLAERLHRAFADPDNSGYTPEQIANLKRWLPGCLPFGVAAAAAKAEAERARNAA